MPNYIIHLPVDVILVSIQSNTHIKRQLCNRKQHNSNQNKEKPVKTTKSQFFICVCVNSNRQSLVRVKNVAQAPNVVEKTCVHVKNAIIYNIDNSYYTSPFGD